MRPDAAPRHKTIRLAEYTPPVWLPRTVKLDFRLNPTATHVSAEIKFELNPARAASDPMDLVLDGEQLKLLAASIDGQSVEPAVTETGLTVAASALPSDGFVWRCEVEIDPQSNKALEGL